MGTMVLFVFYGDKLKEYRLPLIAEGIVNLDLSGSESEDGTRKSLLLEAIDGHWIIASTENIYIINNDKRIDRKQLVPEEVITLAQFDSKAQAKVYIKQEETGLISMDKYSILDAKQISIGASDGDTINYHAPLITSAHAVITIEGGNARVSTGDGKNPIYVNSIKIQSATLAFGDTIFVMGLRVVYLGTLLALNKPKGFIKCRLPQFLGTARNDIEDTSYRKTNTNGDQLFFQRSPRIIKRLEEGQIEIDSPPPPALDKEQPVLLTLGPSFTMGIVSVFSLMFTIQSSHGNPQMVLPGIVMTAGMLAGTILWPILSRMHHKYTKFRDERHRRKKYRQYIKKEYTQLEERIENNRKVLSGIYPEPAVCINRVINKDRRLWERVPSNKDFLDIRLGKGTRPSTIEVKLPREGFSMVEDPLLDELKDINNDFKQMVNVPISISLQETCMVGMVGDRKMLLDTAMCMMVQLAALHSYDEVKIVCVYNQKEAERWEWAKRLPHVWGPEKAIRFITSSRDEVREVFLYLNDILRDREEKIDYSNHQALNLPYYVVFIAEPELVENEPVMRYLTSSSRELGVSTVFLYEKMNMLPKECNAFIQCTDLECSIYHRDNPEGGIVKFIVDEILEQDLESFSDCLAGMKIKEIASTLSLPSMLTFLEMYKVGKIEHLDIRRRWRENLSYRSLEAPIGIKAGNVQYSINIHEKYHGPHGLVAGMTGSGKSEFIQSFILSMAVNYHPHDVSFILIDYKGGGMANCFDGLPHIAGTITNLGGNQVHRSLISLDSELKRRQKIFAEYGVNHIDKYQQLYKEHKASEPLPHLVIITDEFAELKSQQPEFMQELVSAARIGRSLGVHLILATQKPSGVVDDQIWSNTRFRICLKVLDKSDSNEMLKRPEAANITQPGRCYVQVGNDEIFELIQSGWSGAPYIPTDKIENDGDKQVHLIDGSGRALKTAAIASNNARSSHNQLSAVVEYISEVARKDGLMPLRLWLETLKEVIFIEDIETRIGGWNGNNWDETDHWMCPMIGVVDDPKKQAQYALAINIGNDGHLVLFGAPGTGKTTFLQTLIYSLVTSYSPDMVNIYIMDFGGRTMGYYSELPHVGGVVFSDDLEKMEKLFKLITKELDSRKKIFSEYGVGNLKSFMEASRNKIPAIFVMLDNYAAFNELYPDHESIIVTLSREGGNYGIYLVLTGSNTNSIKYRITQNVKLMYTLQLNDKYEYMSIVGQTNGLEPDAFPGRGLVKQGVPLEYQTALVCQSTNEAERVSQLKGLFKEMAKRWRGRRAKQIPSVPDNLSVEAIIESAEGIAEIERGMIPVGYDMEEAEIVSIDIGKAPTLAVLGFDKTGKTNFLKILLKTIKTKFAWKVFVVDSPDGELENVSLKHGADGYICDTAEFDNFINDLIEEMKIRHKDLKAFRSKNDNDKNEKEYMKKYQRIVVMVDNFDSFFDMISDNALSLMENIARGGAGLEVFVVFTANPTKVSKYAGSALYNSVFDGGSGFLLGGRMNSQSIFNVDMSYQQSSAQLDTGYGYLVERNNYKIIKTPLA